MKEKRIAGANNAESISRLRSRT